MAAVGFRNATSAQGNPLASQSFALPTVVAGDLIGLLVGFQTTAGVTISGAGTWTHQGTDGLVAAQVQLAFYTAVSTDGSESGANVTVNVGSQEKIAAIAFTYSGVALSGALANSSPLYATFTTSSTTSATTPSVSPVPASWVLEGFCSKSSTNASYTTPGGLTSRQQVFGSGAGAIDLALFDSNGIVSSAGGHTSTMGTATANKIAFTIVLNTAPAEPLRVFQAVNRAAVI